MSNISFSGIGSGLDTKAIVNALVAAEITPQQEQLKTRKNTFDTQLSALGKLKSAVSEFQSVLDNLKSADKFQMRSVSLSQDEYIAASASSSAQPGQYEIRVQQTAQSQRLITSDGNFASASDAVGSGTLDFTVGSNSFSVQIDPTKNTLEDIRSAINSAEDNNSVTASIVNVDDGVGGTQARLILTSTETGEDNEISITATDDGLGGDLTQLSTGVANGMEEQRAANSAIIFVNDLQATRQSNEINDVISGVTINLKEADAAQTTNLSIGTDNEAIQKNAQGFVDAYNKLQTLIKQLGGESAALVGDSTLRSLNMQTRSIISQPVAGAVAGMDSLAQLGISVDRYGKMSLDASKFSERLSDDFASVSLVFSGDDGVATRLNELFKSYTDSDGLLQNRTDGLNARLKSVDAQQERLQIREESLFNRLSRQFNAMDSMVAQINSNGAFLTAQLANMQM